MMILYSCCFYNGALSGIGLEVWVNVVKGVLTAIKRCVYNYDNIVSTSVCLYSKQRLS